MKPIEKRLDLRLRAHRIELLRSSTIGQEITYSSVQVNHLPLCKHGHYCQFCSPATFSSVRLEVVPLQGLIFTLGLSMHKFIEILGRTRLLSLELDRYISL